MYINLDGVYEHLRIRIVLRVMNRLHELVLVHISYSTHDNPVALYSILPQYPSFKPIIQYGIQDPGARLPTLPPRRTTRRSRRRSKRHAIPRDSHIVRLCDVGSRSSAHVLLSLSGVWLVDVVVEGVDFEEVVEDDHEHGAGAEEEGETVEVVVGDHFVIR